MRSRGFTLIELLVVITIIGLLSTISVVALADARLKARDARRMSDLSHIQTALELFYNDNRGYPSATVPLVLGVGNTACLSSDGFESEGCTGSTPSTAAPYMGKVPSDPSVGGRYLYVSNSSNTFSIVTTLEKHVSNMTGEITLTQNGISDLSP